MHSPGEFLISGSFFSIRWYGLLISLGILAAYFLSLAELKQEKIPENKFDSVFLSTLLSGIIGARIGFVIQNTAYFGQHFAEIFKIWDGGLSIHGAIIMGTAALYLSVKATKLDFRKIANIIAPNVLLAGSIGRWGNFFNQEIIGKPTNYFLKIFIDPAHRPIGLENVSYYHPVFLYESVSLLLAFIFYRILKNRLKNYALVYTLTIYSAIRIIVEFWRIDYKPIFWKFDLAQLVSFGIILFALTFLAVTLTKRQK
jgi:phosphatidylglycerol:prolipoprotein diacylglycerol transferase